MYAPTHSGRARPHRLPVTRHGRDRPWTRSHRPPAGALALGEHYASRLPARPSAAFPRKRGRARPGSAVGPTNVIHNERRVGDGLRVPGRKGRRRRVSGRRGGGLYLGTPVSAATDLSARGVGTLGGASDFRRARRCQQRHEHNVNHRSSYEQKLKSRKWSERKWRYKREMSMWWKSRPGYYSLQL